MSTSTDAVITTDDEAVLGLCLLAAFADGRKDEAEREEMKRVADALDVPNAAAIYRAVLTGRLDADRVAARITDPGMRSFAFEMAVAICDADGATDAQEQAFLDRLAQSFGLEQATATTMVRDGNALASAPVEDDEVIELLPAAGVATAGAAAGAATPAPRPPAPAAPVAPVASTPAAPTAPGKTARDREVDGAILNHAILAGGLELLPEELSTLAIIPIQMKLVHRVGKTYGYTLDRGHIKEFLAVMGIGLTGQVLEGTARKLMGKLGKQLLGSTGKKIAKTATSAALTFGTTYAIGHVAKAYYEGGRKLDRDTMRGLFDRFRGQAEGVYQQHAGQVEQVGRTTKMSDVMRMIGRK